MAPSRHGPASLGAGPSHLLPGRMDPLTPQDSSPSDAVTLTSRRDSSLSRVPVPVPPKATWGRLCWPAPRTELHHAHPRLTPPAKAAPQGLQG